MRKWSYLVGFFLFGAALLFRFQTLHTPFWVDEFSSAYQANLLLEHGSTAFRNPNFYFEYQNITTHLLIALFFKLFGETEFIARFPSMLIGSLVPVALYYFGKRVFNAITGFIAALFATFSYFMITWSRQARGYALQQLLVLVLFGSYFLAFEKGKWQKFWVAMFVVTAIVGVLTHTMFLIALGAVVLHFGLFKRKDLIRVLKHPILYVLVGVLVGSALFSGLATELIMNVTGLLHGHFYNNFWYYHSFLWRQQTLVTFMGLVGLCIGWFTARRYVSLLVIYLLAQLFFLGALFGPYVSRYTLPIFPLLLLGMAYAITASCKAIQESLTARRIPSWMMWVGPLFLTIFIIANGDKFTILPKPFYSVNHDFREVALIDYDQVYAVIRARGRLDEGKTAIIDTWADRMFWYTGTNFQHGYMFRWTDAPGIMKQTPFAFNQEGERVFPDRTDVKFVADLNDLQRVMKKYPRGFIWIDDTTLPADVISYADSNLTKELTLDHYNLDDNPASIWPGTLYSWGISP